METTVPVGSDVVWAQDSGGSGPVVVLLHPGVGDSRQWDRVWPALTAECRVIRYDVRGYDRSPAATQDYTLAGDLRQVLEHFGGSGRIWWAAAWAAAPPSTWHWPSRTGSSR